MPDPNQTTNEAKPREVVLFPETSSPATLVIPPHYTEEQGNALVAYLRARAAGEVVDKPDLPPRPTDAP